MHEQEGSWEEKKVDHDEDIALKKKVENIANYKIYLSVVMFFHLLGTFVFNRPEQSYH